MEKKKQANKGIFVIPFPSSSSFTGITTHYGF
jgi:hypothetical protein